MLDQEMPESAFEPVDETHEYILFRDYTNEEFLVQEKETGMNWYARNLKEAQRMIKGGRAFDSSTPGKERDLGHKNETLSREEKFDRQREILDDFGDRMVEFLAKSTPHEEALGLDAKGLLMRCTREVENGNLLSKEELQKLRDLYDQMSI